MKDELKSGVRETFSARRAGLYTFLKGKLIGLRGDLAIYFEDCGETSDPLIVSLASKAFGLTPGLGNILVDPCQMVCTFWGTLRIAGPNSQIYGVSREGLPVRIGGYLGLNNRCASIEVSGCFPSDQTGIRQPVLKPGA